MAIRKLLGYAALAAGIATGAQALASGVNGDIYDIRPCEYDGTTRGAWATADAPLSSGVTTYFKIRLIQGAKDDNDTTWFIDHVGLGSTIVDDALYPLQVGIYVSGKLRMATLVDSRPNSPASGFTELVFEYKTQPGDFAMPIVLATEAGPATASTGSTAYLFNRTDKWKITNNNAENCNLWFWEQGSGLGWPVADPEGGRVQDYSLARLAGLYVKTIDFDSKWEAARDSTDPLWRSVHQDSTITVGATPTLAAIAAASNNVTLYVWSTDDSAVRIRGGAPTDIVIGYDAGNPITTNTLVGSVTIAGGQVYQSFEIEGVSMTGGAGGDGKCELVLSPWPNYTYLGGTADRLIDYVTVPVKCVEPLPTTLIVNVENDPAYAKVGDGWKSYSTTLDVYLSQPLTEDIDVTITPSIAGHGELNMADYVKFSKTAPTVKTIASLSDTVTVTIPAGQLRSTTNPKIYVFFLKGDEFTSGGATIDFTPSISAAQQASTGLNTDDRFVAGGCEVVARPPEFVAPEEGSEIGATAGVAQEIEIEVADTYADQQIAAPADGYKIEVKYNDATGWKELDGSYYIGTGNLLRKADGTLPELTYTTSSASTSTGTFTTQIRVTEPINGNRAVVRLIATVAAPKTVAVTADADSYNEGASAKFTVQLNADNDTGAPLYAFLVAGPDTVNKDMFKALGRQCVITPDMTPADYPTTSGLVINPDNGGPGKEVIGTVKLLDGESEDVGGSSFYFTVKLCTTSYYDPGNVVTGYNSNYATIQVFNVEPTITRVEMNGYEPLDDGYFDGKYPVGQAQTFQAIVKDAGGFDLDNGFHTRWTITRVGGGVQIPVDDIVGNPNEDANKKTVTFVQAGTYKIKVQVHDKDMEDWAAAYNETFVVVVAQPQLSVEMPDTPDENLTRQKLMVSLGGYYNAAEPMVVMITVIPPSTTSVNPGVLTFDSAYATVPAGFEALADAAIAAEGSAAYPHYFMSFSGTEGQEISVLEMDGTVLSLSPGFSVKAQVLNNGVSSDPAKTWAEYYLPTTQRFYINNVAPVCVVTEPSTSRWEVAGGAATSYPIRWTVRSDVDNDYDGLWDDGVTRGIKVSFSGCDNADDGLTYVTSRTTGTSGVFVPNFGSAQGDQVVTLTIEDKDGGYTTWTYLYTVAASKFLTTIANGPNGGTTTSPLSRKYSLLGRDVFGSLGQGHTWVESATFSSAKNFRLRWNCGKNPSATIYAFGYKVTAPDDNGTLDAGMDIAVDTTGYAVAGTPVANPYHYPFADYAADSDDRKDSFFYCWLQHSSGADGGSMTSTVLGGAITPETPGAVASGRVDLPTEQTQDKNYLDSEVEAIFSREWMPADNCGDINADGVPDAYAMAVWKGGNLIELMDGDILENDLMDLAGANPDEDYLPGVYRGAGGTALVNGSGNSYAPIGSPFSSRLEFRGFRSGLNARDLARSDISFIDVLLRDSDPEYDVEERAWQKYAADNGLDPDADRSLDNWSPEPRSARYARMDPTLEDTDADKFPDGWEYYFWYMAKVWLPAHQQEAKDGDIGVPRSGQHFVFERFTLDNIVVGEEISAADVMARFDPCSPYNGSNHDLDNDGLSDLEELALGTNPCHWDTDGDRMCDGWEVMMCLDPLNGSKRDNPDGDYMAYRSVRLDMCWIDPASADPANLDANGAVVDKYAEGLRIYGLPGLQQGVDYDTDMTGKYVMLQTVDVVCYSFTPKYLNGDRLVYGLREDIPLVIPQDWVWGWYMVDEVRCETITMNAGEEIFTDLEYVLIHDQVRDGFGFDPRTGWGRNGNGYVTDRWDPNHNARNVSLFDETGLAVNTRAYETYDEYLVMKYRLDYGIDYAPLTTSTPPNAASDDPYDPARESMWAFIRRKTTNPNVVKAEKAEDAEGAAEGDAEGDAEGETASETVAERIAEAFNSVGSDKSPVTTHGADTDEDGVPDGWELYMYRTPNSSPNEAEEDGRGLPGARDFDGDTLAWASEYAGVDSCNVYEGCASIYRNHPGNNSFWFNKFFPTNPGTMKLSDENGTTNLAGTGNADGEDTDLDGVTDGQEGDAWGTVFANGGNQYDVMLGFIYGSPTDEDRLTVCFRGGGMNPCTIDTDLDGLPDGWEMQHAGVPVQLPNKTVISPRGGDAGGIQLDAATFIADGIYAEDAAIPSNGVYIAGGMDATWGGDAAFDSTDGNGSGSWDELLGTRRDVDFDHDGLQNYQEYLTQSMRHFRYDDITTPLMGRQLQEGDYDPDTNAIASPHTQSFGDKTGETDGTGTGYPVFDPANPETFAANAAEAWNGRSFVYYETVTTGVREVIKVIDPYTGATSTNRVFYTARRKLFKEGAVLVADHVAHGGTGLQEAWNVDGWRTIGYFAPPRHTWDRAIASASFQEPLPLYMYPITDGMMVGTSASVAGYATTDPRFADTDGDGMDDFYEMYHGLNPMLGTTPATAEQTQWVGSKSGDIVSAQFYMAGYPLTDSRPTFNAWYNEWIYPTYSGLLGREGNAPGDEVGGPIQVPQAYDPILYPWSMGTPMVDADGDGMRNDDERIVANVADPVARHTDPTPLWFTERTTPASYVAQYYVTAEDLKGMPWGGAASDVYEDASLRSDTDATTTLYFPPDLDVAYQFSFEENEGYDTDGDMTPDSTEVVSMVRASSDPLRFDDPVRRQAFYLPGVESYAISRDLQYRASDSEDFLKQFTVECWVLPEKTGVAQTIIDRPVAVEGDAINTDKLAIRSNFRIGLDPQGKVYGMFDNNDSIESGLDAPKSCQFVDGGPLPLNEWSHVALTFNGTELVIYVNGLLKDKATTALIPANGVTQILQNPGSEGMFPAYQYRCQPSAFLIGARPQRQNVYALYPYYIEEDENGDLVHKEAFTNLLEYFQGYVDEVRVWDGARTGTQILDNYEKSLGFADAKDNRESVFISWYQNNGTRNNNDGNPMLPAELVLNYDFSTLPGAASADEVAKAPVGFKKNVLAAAMSDYATNEDIDTTGLYPNLMELKGAEDGGVEGDLLVGWWNESLVHSTVYTDYHVVPWIKNTVSHLPLMDGGAADSFLYSDDFGAVYTPAADVGVGKFVFPNTAMPYPATVFNADRYYRLAHAKILVEQRGDDFQIALGMSQFQVRNNFTGTADLVPMGGAFAKTCPKLWDGNVSDPWEQTGSDSNGDGIPDWWDEYARHNYTPDIDPAEPVGWETLVDYHGTTMPAGKAYVIDIYRGMQPDGSFDPAYAVNTDADGDNIPDWWENLFGVAGYGAEDDTDGDGLSNYAEYLFSFGSEPYGMERGFPFLDPANQRTGAGQQVTDYFLRGPAEDIASEDGSIIHIFANQYLGEIATDHDFVEDWWENLYSRGYANPRQYDPLLDRDEDGWSNFAEARSINWKALYAADSIDRFTDTDYHEDLHPTPAFGIRPTYYGSQDIGGATLIVRTSNGSAARMDSKFIVPAVAQGDTKYIGGINVNAVMHGFLSPGSVTPSSVVFEKAVVSSDRTYVWNWDWYIERGEYSFLWDYITGDFETYKYYKLRYPNIELEGGELTWEAFATSVGDVLGQKAKIVHTDTQATIGTIDLKTGEWALDTAKLAEVDENQALLGDSVLRVTYSSHVGHEWPKTVWLADTRQFSAGTTAQAGDGYIKEGANMIEAFFDLDNNGEYTAGEPYGVKKGVDIGWHKTPEVVIELRDTTSVVPRINLVDGSSDRVAAEGTTSGVAMSMGGGGDGGGDGSDSGSGLTKTVRITRESINGEKSRSRQMMAHTYVLDDRAYIMEGDLLSESAGRFDLDWRYLAADAAEMGVKVATAEYTVEETYNIVGGGISNVLLGAFTREFKANRPSAVPVKPVQSEEVYTSSPALAFMCDDETATAFKIQVADADGNVIYDSGVKLLSGRSAESVGEFVHRFTPPIYADAPVVTNGAPLFADNGEYKWRVAMFNAAYPLATLEETDWSQWADFTMDVGNMRISPSIPTGFGKAGTVVRYYGPLTDELVFDGGIVVEAYGSADFRGQPLAQVRLAETEDLTNRIDITTVNAVLKGIEPGTVYLMAYIDQNNNGRRDKWESWGYANYVGTSHEDIYTPKGVEVADSLLVFPKTVIYIEDCDLNRNEVPDSLEPENFPSVDSEDEDDSADSDGDGLGFGSEEEIGTDPGAWDTDGDGMPDGWEYESSDDVLDPLDPDSSVRGDDDDVMAYAEVPAYLITVRDAAAELAVVGTVYALLDTSAPPPQVGDSMAGKKLYTTYAYGEKTGVGLKVTIPGGDWRVIAVEEDATVALVHAQVYDRFGFSSKTCVMDEDAVNTKRMTALDKYLVVRYLEAIGVVDPEMAADDTLEVWMNVNRQWNGYTLKAKNKDVDLDGINDGWELYVMFGPDGVGSETALTDVVVSPWNYDDARLDSPSGEAVGFRLLDEFDRGVAPTDPWQADSNGDGVSDALAFKYHLKGTLALADNDGDGLCNYVEYLLSEVFDLGKKFAPDNAYSVNANKPDYFAKVGSLYVGEVFADHDMVEDLLEDEWGLDFANRYVWDALSDKDEDGWSNFAEARYRNFTARIIAPNASHIVGDAEVKDMPVPTLRLTLRYNGEQPLKAGTSSSQGQQQGGQQQGGDANTLAPIVVQTFTKGQLVVPDATFNVQPGDTKSSTLYLGAWADRIVRGTLTPGYVNAGTFKIEFANIDRNEYYSAYIHDLATISEELGQMYPDGYYSLSYADYLAFYNAFGPEYVELQSQEFAWNHFNDANVITVTQDESGRDAHICLLGTRIGDVDLTTGEFSLDMGPLANVGSTSTNEAESASVTMRQTVMRLSYDSVVPKLQSNRLKLYLGDPETGYVREGANTVVAFYDLNGDGLYTPGEPMGVATDVDVGWHAGSAEIELTDTCPIITRAAIEVTEGDAAVTSSVGGEGAGESGAGESGNGNAVASTDRHLLYGTEDGDCGVLQIGNTSNGKKELFQVVRTLVNGRSVADFGIENRVVLQKWLELDQRNFLFEGDVFAGGEFDLDWRFFREITSNSPEDVTNVTYRIVLGNGDLSLETTNNLLSVATTRHFDLSVARARPVSLSPGTADSVCFGPRPTFKWTMNGFDTYTAFSVQIRDGSTTVWDSGVRMAPARDSNGVYTFEADAYVGAELENNKNYTWRVSMYNAKFQTAAWSSENYTFRMNVPTDGYVYGSIPVCVRYYGPSGVPNGAYLYVEAFDTPDFTGLPVSRAIADNTTASVMSIGPRTANMTLLGAPKGTYYVRAYFDMKEYGTDGERDAFESWGYACGREKSKDAPFTPSAVAVSFADGSQNVVDVYIEDVDTNGNYLPDAWEMVQNRGKLYSGAEKLDVTLKGSFPIRDSSMDGISTKVASAGVVAEGLQTRVAMALASKQAVALSLGVEPEKVSASGGMVCVESDVASVQVSSIGFDGEGNIVISVAGVQKDTESGSGLYANVVTVPVTVACKVYRKESLDAADWGAPVAEQTISVGGDAETVAVPGCDSASGFFKVVIESQQ